MEGHVGMDVPVSDTDNFRCRLASPSEFRAIAHTFVMEWATVIANHRRLAHRWRRDDMDTGHLLTAPVSWRARLGRSGVGLGRVVSDVLECKVGEFGGEFA